MIRTTTGLVLLLVLTQLTLSAWEIDVHYLLTWWLATKAGFSRGDADQIAKADQSYDDSDHHAAIPTVLGIVFRGDVGGARDLQKKHFPSDAQLPAPALRRVVTPNSAAAREAVLAAIRPNALGTALEELGEGLHPFQDSWAHQGVPDVPLRPALQFRSELSCAHPEARGGWWSHNADLTYLHVTDTEAMARETYTLLLDYLNKNPRLREHPAAKWADLQPIVHEFAVSGIQSQKNDWAVKYVPASQDQTKALTLSGTRLRTPARAIKPPTEGSAESLVPKDLVQQANEFATLWLDKYDIRSAAETYVDSARLSEQVSGLRQNPGQAPLNVVTWSRKVLAMYLADDHAAVNAAGHGNPGSPGYQDLPETAMSEGRFRSSSYVPFAAISPSDFIRVEPGVGGRFAVAIQPSGLSHDALCLVWDQTTAGWRITRMLPLVE